MDFFQGNEHVQYLTPEGERYTINGVEQLPPGRAIKGPPSAPPVAPPPSQAPNATSFGGNNQNAAATCAPSLLQETPVVPPVPVKAKVTYDQRV